MKGNGEFKQLPTFDALCRRLAEMEQCVGARGEMMLELMQQAREREMEIAFLMSIVNVIIPTSKIAGADGKIPAIRRLARDLWVEEGRAKTLAVFEARAKAEQDEQNLQEAVRQHGPASEEPAQAAEDRTSTIPFTLPGKVTH
jgi:hypothetical protein